MSKALPPVIKWSGSKRSVAAQLASLFPEYERYYEPFVGGGAMLPFRKVRQGYASDIMPELIQLWAVIRDEPQSAIEGYSMRWHARQRDGHRVYYEIRDHFNLTRDPIDFLFLSRTCVNGLIRFNKDGNFNNSLHHTRPGVAPETLGQVITMWSQAIQGVEFTNADYASALLNVTERDFVFLDPPYESTRGRYLQGSFLFDRFYSELDRLNRIGAKWMLTYDGQAGERRYDVGLPREIYKTKVDIYTGNSPFTRMMKQDIDMVTESVYLNYEPPNGLSCCSVQSALDFREMPVCLEV
ncbi:MAG: DNA adenine methylase [Terracidiphilus sp.]